MSSRSLFFFNDTATTEIYTLSLHDALPICAVGLACECLNREYYCTELDEKYYNIILQRLGELNKANSKPRDRKSTRMNSSHANISYAVFCLKKKNISNSSSRLSSTLIARPY